MTLANAELLLDDPLGRLIIFSVVVLAVGAMVAWVLRRRSADFLRTLWTSLLIGQLCAAPVCFLNSGLEWLPNRSVTRVAPQPVLIDPPARAPSYAGTDSIVVVKEPEKVLRQPAFNAPQLQDSHPVYPQFTWRTLAYACWLGGVVLLFLRAGIGTLLCSHRYSTGRTAENPLMLLAAGRRSRLRVLHCSEAASPSASGVLSPRIVLPEASRDWPQKRRRFVLLHEMIHIRRKDCAVSMLAHFSCALFWFNPLVWLACRQLRTAIERSCDDEVVRGTRSPSAYAEALLATVHEAIQLKSNYMMGMADGPLFVRVQEILDPTRPRVRFARWPRQLTTALTLLSAIVVAAIRPTIPSAMASDTPEFPVQVIRDRSGQLLYDRNRADAFPFDTTAANMLYALINDESPSAERHLTIDLHMQRAVEKSLSRVRRGGAVLLDPNTGDILALASVPTFSPGKAVEQWDALNADPLAPLTNRAVNATALGATFLPVTALAGGMKGHSGLKFTCSGGVTYGGTFMRCWSAHPHGTLGLAEALQHSCNAYFYQFGNACGINFIGKVSDALGLGRCNQVIPGESPGLLPSPDWLRQTAPEQRWSMGHTACVSIGQGAVTATPLQMATIAGAIGTGGMVFGPRLDLKSPTRLRANLLHKGVDSGSIEAVRKSMWSAVNGEKASGEQVIPRESGIAGQMGLGLVRREKADGGFVHETDAWFIGFAPFENPRFAIAVCVEGDASEGEDSATIAVEILREILGVRPSATSMRSARLKPQGTPITRLTWVEIVARDAGKNHFDIDHGTMHGVYANCFVRNDDGIVGQVVEVRELTSKVALIGREGCRVAASVWNERNERMADGIIQGTPDEGGNDIVELHLAHPSNVTPGNLVTTTGTDGNSPNREPIGRVIDVTSDGTNPGLIVRVKLAANLARIEDVSVVLP